MNTNPTPATFCAMNSTQTQILQTAWEQYVNAHQEMERIEKDLLDSSNELIGAKIKTAEAWDKYKILKEELGDATAHPSPS